MNCPHCTLLYVFWHGWVQDDRRGITYTCPNGHMWTIWEKNE